MERGGARGQMSHMQSKYPILGNNVMKIELLSQARLRGVDVTVDEPAGNIESPGDILPLHDVSFPDSRDNGSHADLIRSGEDRLDGVEPCLKARRTSVVQPLERF